MTPSLLIAALGITALLAIALWADRRFRSLSRLPMNWAGSGKVTLTAPRRIALATVPALAAATLVLALANPDRGLATPLGVSLLLLGFAALQAAHLVLIDGAR